MPVYKHYFYYSNVPTTVTKKPYALTANEALVGTLMAICDINNVFAIACRRGESFLIIVRNYATCLQIKPLTMAACKNRESSVNDQFGG